jgi:dCMP deaminase
VDERIRKGNSMAGTTNETRIIKKWRDLFFPDAALFNKLKSRIKKWAKHVKKRDIPSWDDYFISMAFLASTRSCDADTQCGTVIVDKDKRILALGYNGLPRGVNDDIVPNSRCPDCGVDHPGYKYSFVIHSEANALYNCLVRPEGGTAYMVNRPCIECLKAMHQEGIVEVVYIEGLMTNMQKNDDEEAVFSALVALTGIKIRCVKINFDHVKRLTEKIDNMVDKQS